MMPLRLCNWLKRYTKKVGIKISDENFWGDSRNYNVTEAVHAVLIFCVVDMLIKKAEYATSDI